MNLSNIYGEALEELSLRDLAIIARHVYYHVQNGMIPGILGNPPSEETAFAFMTDVDHLVDCATALEEAYHGK